MAKKSTKEKNVHNVEKEFIKAHKRIKNLLISLAVFAFIVILILIAVSFSAKPCSDLEGTEKDECLQKVALEELEEKYCDLLSVPQLKEACIVDLAIATSDAALCADLSDLSKGRCLKNLATIHTNPDFCEQISNEYWHDLCYYSLSNITDDRNYCRKITSLQQRDECFYTFAISRNSSIACNGITDSTLQGKCNLNIAVVTNDVSICIKAVKGSYKGMCYQHFAFSTNDPSYCANITAGVIRNDCYAYFNLTAPANEEDELEGGLIIEY